MLSKKTFTAKSLVNALPALGLGSVLLLGTAQLAQAETAKPATAPAAATAAKGGFQYFPLQSYRVGPYAAGGTGFFGGFIDYLNLINTRDGGVNGVKFNWLSLIHI